MTILVGLILSALRSAFSMLLSQGIKAGVPKLLRRIARRKPATPEDDVPTVPVP